MKRNRIGMLLIAGAVLALPAAALENGPRRGVPGIQIFPQQQQQQPSWRGPGGPAPSGQPQAGAVHKHRPHISQWLKKNQGRPLADQEKSLASDPEFQKLPPEKQDHFKELLRNFNSKTPEQQQRILQRMDAFEHLTPEQQDQARQIYSQVRQMPDEQRKRFREGMRELAESKPEQRQGLLDSGDFRSRYTDEERGLMRQFLNLNVLPERNEPESSPAGPPAQPR